MSIWDVGSVRSRLIIKLSKLAVVALGGLAVCSCQTVGDGSRRTAGSEPVEASSERAIAADRVIEELGIEVVAIRTTAAGSMLDFRFKVLDKDKAMPLFLKELKPHLIDEQTGAVLEVPVPAKGGPMRPTSRDPRLGITYFMLFGNPGQFVKPGRQVSILIGEHKIEHLIVQ